MATNIRNIRAFGVGAAVFNSRNRAIAPTSSSVFCKMGFQGKKVVVAGDSEKKSAKALVVLADRSASSKTQTSEAINLALILTNVGAIAFQGYVVITTQRPWRSHIHMLIESVVINSRFFTMLAVAGTLLGSVLCFVEGCFIIIETYLQYLKAISHGAGSDHGHHMVQLLIEAMDMYLVGTAMLIFGTGLYVMFVGTQYFKRKQSLVHSKSNFFGLFYLQKLPSWTGLKSIAQAKTKIGHALMMILQVGVLDKFKSIPLGNGLDLACFAAALFISSASIFLLSRLTSASDQHVAQKST